MKVGDLVAHKRDINRKIECVGVVVKLLKKGHTGHPHSERWPKTSRDEALVAWASESAHVPAWYYLEYLVVINESR